MTKVYFSSTFSLNLSIITQMIECTENIKVLIYYDFRINLV